MDVNLIKHTNDLIHGTSECVIAVLEEGGSPHASVVTRVRDDGMAMSWFSTGLRSNKVRCLRRDPRCSLCFHIGADNITLVGRAHILTGRDIRHELWQDWFLPHFPEGKDDPNYCILRFETDHVSLWVDQQSAEFTLADLLTPQSRCGLLCSHCAFKEPYHCGGCLETDGHPFHGACPVAACCGGKGYTHCGQCPDLPCDLMLDYSVRDPEHGDRPPYARIEMVRKWAGGTFRGE